MICFRIIYGNGSYKNLVGTNSIFLSKTIDFRKKQKKNGNKKHKNWQKMVWMYSNCPKWFHHPYKLCCPYLFLIFHEQNGSLLHNKLSNLLAPPYTMYLTILPP